MFANKQGGDFKVLHALLAAAGSGANNEGKSVFGGGIMSVG